jgi:3-methyladenine DNA glycosylase AlkC
MLCTKEKDILSSKCFALVKHLEGDKERNTKKGVQSNSNKIKKERGTRFFFVFVFFLWTTKKRKGVLFFFCFVRNK